MKINLFVILTMMLSAGVAGAASSPITIGVLADGETAFWTSVRDAIQEAAKEQEVTVDFKIPEPATVEQQNKLAREMVEKGVQTIAIAPINPAEQTEIFKEIAVKAPLVTMMQDVPDSNRAAFLARDEKQVGKLLGEGALKNLPPGVKVMAFCKNPDSPETKAGI